MDFRAIAVLLSLMIALLARKNAIAARDPTLAELREHLQNTTDYKCWYIIYNAIYH